MALTADDLSSIAGLIDTRVGALIDSRVNSAKFGGPTIQVSPRDLVYLGNGDYVSEAKGKVYKKGGQGRLIEMGDIPAPV